MQNYLKTIDNVIVGDDTDILIGQNFVQTDFHTGLTDEDLNEMKVFQKCLDEYKFYQILLDFELLKFIVYKQNIKIFYKICKLCR